jgi:hypothetical protein
MKIKLYAAMLALVGMATFLQAETNNETLFNKNEVGVSLSGSYLKKSEKNWSGALGVNAFPLQRYVGAEVSTTIQEREGTLLENVQVDLVGRIPFDKYNLAIGAKGGALRDFNTGDNDYGVGPFVEYRFNQNWGLRVEHRFIFEQGDRDDNQETRFGVNLVF